MTTNTTNPSGKAPPIEKQVAFLRRVPLLRGFDDGLLQALAGVMSLKRYAAGSVLCEEGGAGDCCFIVGAGKVDVLSVKDGKEHVLATLAAGQAVGELALVDGQRRSATVRCQTDTTVFVLGRQDFQQLLDGGNHASMKLLDNLAHMLVARVQEAGDRYTDIFSRPGETMLKLSEALRELQASIEVFASPTPADEEAELLRMLGYQGDRVPNRNTGAR